MSSPADTAEQACTSCGESCPIDAKWCEACGTDLAPPASAKRPCVSCSAVAVEITDDGWCQICGTKQPAPEDHVVADHGWFAVVSDKGRVHRTNEDTGGVAARPTGVALVVCDGVSSTNASEQASQSAVRSIVDSIENDARRDVSAVIVGAAQAAQDEILRVTTPAAGEPPSCTMVTVIADTRGDEADLLFGWLGDSRAYWLADGTATQLTTDHSWATEQHALGELDAETIDADPRSGSITRWLGADSHDVIPELASLTVRLPGMLLVCSDGLWNYVQTEAELHAAVYATGPDSGETVLERAERLVSFANSQGGHDNITVALAELTPKDPQPPVPAMPDPQE